VHVRAGGQARADVQELPDASLARQVRGHPPHHGPVSAHPDGHVRVAGDRRLGGPAIGLEVVLAAENVVVDPGRMGHGRIDLGGLA